VRADLAAAGGRARSQRLDDRLSGHADLARADFSPIGINLTPYSTTPQASKDSETASSCLGKK